jgi:hypothetical protein
MKMSGLGWPRLRASRREMQLGFATTALCTLCNSREKLQSHLGHDTAGNVMDLLFFLDAAPTLDDLSELPPISRCELSSAGPMQFSVGRIGDGQILFESIAPGKSSKLSDIDRIKIRKIAGSI